MVCILKPIPAGKQTFFASNHYETQQQLRKRNAGGWKERLENRKGKVDRQESRK